MHRSPACLPKRFDSLRRDTTHQAVVSIVCPRWGGWLALVAGGNASSNAAALLACTSTAFFNTAMPMAWFVAVVAIVVAR